VTGDKVEKETMAFAHLSDPEMALKVRMLTRNQLDHESVCVGARDRIMYLSQQLKISDAKVNNLEEEKALLEEKIYDLEEDISRSRYGEDY
jgi:hypothetical protein